MLCRDRWGNTALYEISELFKTDQKYQQVYDILSSNIPSSSKKQGTALL